MIKIMITNNVTLNTASFIIFTLYYLPQKCSRIATKVIRKNNTCLVLVSLRTTTTSNEKKLNFLRFTRHEEFLENLLKVT